MRAAVRGRAVVGTALFALLTGLPGSMAVASGQSPPPPSTAPVRVDGEVLFQVRGVSALPADERAAEIVRAIVAVARNRSIEPDSVHAELSNLGVQFVAGGQALFTIVEADAELEGVRIDQLSGVIESRIRAVVRSYRADREPGRLARHALTALLGLLVLLAAARLVGWITRHVRQWIEGRIKPRVESVQARTAHIVQAARIWKILYGAMTGVRTVAILVLIYLYLQASLELFPWTRYLGRRLLGLIADPLRVLGTATVEQIPSLLFLVVLIAMVRWTLKAIGLGFNALERGDIVLSGFDPEWAVPTYRIVRVLLIAFTVVVAYPYIPGSQSGAFKGVTISLGLLVSIGSSSTLANIIAGYSMIYRRAFRAGDRILVNGLFGDVSEIRLLVTTLRSPKNEQIVVPNSILLNSPIVNYSALARAGGLILHTTVGIGYETPWRQVEAMLLMAADRTEGLSGSPPPFVRQQSLGDFCVVYELNAYSPSAQEMLSLYDEMHRNILDVFNEYGVQIMTPAYEGDPEVPKVVPRAQWFAEPAQARPKEG